MDRKYRIFFSLMYSICITGKIRKLQTIYTNHELFCSWFTSMICFRYQLCLSWDYTAKLTVQLIELSSNQEVNGELIDFNRANGEVLMSRGGLWTFGELRSNNADVSGFFYGGLRLVSCITAETPCLV